MDTLQTSHFRRTVKHVAFGGACVAAITAVCYPLRADFAITGCLYLLLVVVQSTFASFTASAIVAVIAIGCLDYFFIPPLLTLRVSSPIDALGLVTFLITTLVITRLASKARQEARNADARRKDLARLYDVASHLVSVSPQVAVAQGYLGIFREICDLRAACLFDGMAGTVTCDGKSEQALSDRTREAYASGRDYQDEGAQVAVRCLRVGGKLIGVAGFEGLARAESTAGPLAMLATAMIQRAHSFAAASEAAAAAQVEVLRSAILDAFAHQFKTPLASILTAAGSLREIGPLVPVQHDMVETIEAQAAGLGRLTTRLLRMARLDRDEIQPRLQITDLRSVVSTLADPYRNSANGQIFVLKMGEKAVDVLSDPDMLGLAIVQLLDNAFRYSQPASTITVTVDSVEESAIVRVTNEGSEILPEEQNRIFDRFYRGAAGHYASGTGLGLYVAKKIVLAHGGTLQLDTEHVYGQGTTFYLRMPIAKKERKHELKAS
jgi:two-component system, OmpR family, sensor histidine kinase KdpD